MNSLTSLAAAVLDARKARDSMQAGLEYRDAQRASAEARDRFIGHVLTATHMQVADVLAELLANGSVSEDAILALGKR